MGFPDHFIKLIMECVQHPSYSILLNGTSFGYFKGTRGLRQGCPLSPFLFAIVMEFFSIMMTMCAYSQLIPTPFVKGNVAISHLIFADDVSIFSRGTLYAAYNFKKLLEDFHRFSGLGVNWYKSSIIFSCCDEETRTMIKGILNVTEGSFPFRYLGIPMSSRRLFHHDYIPLLEKF